MRPDIPRERVDDTGAGLPAAVSRAVHTPLRVDLPPTMRHDRPLSAEDLETVRQQWQLLHEISTVLIPNEIPIRRAAGLPELPRGTLAHGTVFDLDKMRSIAERGIVSGEMIGIGEDGETHYCADFFRVPEDMSIGEYVAWYDSMEPQEHGSSFRRGRMERNYLARRTG